MGPSVAIVPASERSRHMRGLECDHARGEAYSGSLRGVTSHFNALPFGSLGRG